MNTTTLSYRDRIDAQAESEAESLLWMEENLGSGPTRRVPLSEQKLREPLMRNCRYPLAASLRANDRINRIDWRKLVNWMVSKDTEFVFTKDDRAAQAQ